MLGRDGHDNVIDPTWDEPVRVTVRNGHASWQPESAVMVAGPPLPTAGPDTGCSPPSDAAEWTVTVAAPASGGAESIV